MKKIKKLLIGSLLCVMLMPTITQAKEIKDVGEPICYGWFTYSNHWMHNDNTGKLQKSTWILDKNKWYYVDANGYMVTGWQKIKNKWYYFNKNGSMKTGWLKYNNKWYYFNPKSGAISTG